MKIFLAIVGFLLLIPVSIFLVAVLNFQVIGPFTHAQNTKKAEKFNDSAWESGIADIYTLRASAELYGETIAIEQELVCARKMETSTISIKGGPYLWDSQINLNVIDLTLRPAQHYRIEVGERISCPSIARFAKGGEFPALYSGFTSASIQVFSSPTGSCRLYLNGEPFRSQDLTIFPIAVVAKRKMLIRDIVSREEFGPADRAISRANERQANPRQARTPTDFRFGWSVLNQCWQSSAGICSPIADDICVP